MSQAGELPFSDNLCWLLDRAATALGARLDAEFEALGFVPRGHLVLSVAARETHTQGQIARIAGLDKTTMTVTLDALEASGLAKRTPSPTDRRAHVVGVTPAGRRKLRAADELIHRVHDEVLDVVPEDQREALYSALSALVRGPLAEP